MDEDKLRSDALLNEFRRANYALGNAIDSASRELQRADWERRESHWRASMEEARQHFIELRLLFAKHKVYLRGGNDGT